jgi:hypothetical protein
VEERGRGREGWAVLDMASGGRGMGGTAGRRSIWPAEDVAGDGQATLDLAGEGCDRGGTAERMGDLGGWHSIWPGLGRISSLSDHSTSSVA